MENAVFIHSDTIARTSIGRAFSLFCIVETNLGLRPRLVSGRAFSAQMRLGRFLRAAGPASYQPGRSPRTRFKRLRGLKARPIDPS